MKIGILTQPLGVNYGGMLQNWALQEVLKQMGHTPITIQLRGIPKWKTDYYRCCAVLRFYLKKLIFHPTRNIEIRYSRLSAKYRDMRKFVKRRITTTKPLFGISLKKLRPYGVDVCIVGSDQVWRPKYNKHNFGAMFGDFLGVGSDVRCISYAASFGVDEWELSPRWTAIARICISGFSAVSVRERSGVELCRQYLGVEAQHVLDPTLLLKSESYAGLLSETEIRKLPKEPFVAVYILDSSEDKKRIVEQLSRKLRLITYNIAETDSVSDLLPSTELWVAAIHRAAFVITDSFHGTAFSINFHKPFVVLGNEARGNGRFMSLLGMVGLVNRYISDATSESAYDIAVEKINWDEVEYVLNDNRKKSLGFLKDALQ